MLENDENPQFIREIMEERKRKLEQRRIIILDVVITLLTSALCAGIAILIYVVVFK